MAVQRFRFSKASVEAVLTPDKLTFYRDSDTSALGLWVTPTGNKSYFAAVREDGKTQRIVIGKHPAIAPSVARKRAGDLAAKARTGGTPVADKKRRKKVQSITLRALVETYLAVKRTRNNLPLKDSTKDDYRRAMRETWLDYLDKPANALTERVVRRRYEKRRDASPARTDLAHRALKAVFNWAISSGEYEDVITDNPTGIIERGQGFRAVIEARDSYLDERQIPAWWRAVHGLRNTVARDYLLFLFFCGTRRTETAKLDWQAIDFAAGTFTLHDTKNRKTVTLPLPGYTRSLIEQRKASEGWVFPGTDGYYARPDTAIKAVAKEAGFDWAPHDLRRTFGTYAGELDINYLTIKGLLNHKISKRDISAAYVHSHTKLSSLTSASEKIERKLLTLAGASADAKVININERRA
jgi:integrase